MSDLSRNIEKAILSLENDILPKASMIGLKDSDKIFLKSKQDELERLHKQSLESPVFSIRFIGDTQNGKSTLINVLLGKKVLPEGHVGACSATIVRCRYVNKEKYTITFRYCSEEQFITDLTQKAEDAELALEEEKSDGDKRETVRKLLGRFLNLLKVDPDAIDDPKELITTCRDLALEFEERTFFGTEQIIDVNQDNEKFIHENLSARGRRAFIVDECIIEGAFPDWNPYMELVDMPGTNAFNPWDDQVNVRLKQKIGGLAVITKETQLHQTVMDWFKESSILSEIAGSSERNQTRVFIIKTFIDQLDLADESEESEWEQTKSYCNEIEIHLREQIMNLINNRFSADNELEILKQFVEKMPIHFISPKVYRNLADPGLRNRVLNNPLKNLKTAALFQRFDTNPDNAGINQLRNEINRQTDDFIRNHYLKKLNLDYEKEVGAIARFFRTQRTAVEQRLANKGKFVLEVDRQIQGDLKEAFKRFRDKSEQKIVSLKNKFKAETSVLLKEIEKQFSAKVRRKLDDWLVLHWASLRCTGRKNGQHITARGHEIDFNGSLADFCVESLNSSWISHRQRLREFLYDDLQVNFLPEIDKAVARAKGHDSKDREELICSTYEEVAQSARSEVELQVQHYDSETEEFDALRPTLIIKIREFLAPTYEGIASEAGRGSAARMRTHLSKGVTSSSHEIGAMVKQTVEQNWEGLTGSVEKRVIVFYDDLEKQFNEQGERLRELSEHPSEGDEQLAKNLSDLEDIADQLSSVESS